MEILLVANWSIAGHVSWGVGRFNYIEIYAAARGHTIFVGSAEVGLLSTVSFM